MDIISILVNTQAAGGNAPPLSPEAEGGASGLGEGPAAPICVGENGGLGGRATPAHIMDNAAHQ